MCRKFWLDEKNIRLNSTKTTFQEDEEVEEGVEEEEKVAIMFGNVWFLKTNLAIGGEILFEIIWMTIEKHRLSKIQELKPHYWI